MYLTKRHQVSTTPSVPAIPSVPARTVCTPSAPPPPRLSGGTSDPVKCGWKYVPTTKEDIGMGGVVNGGQWVWVCE